MANYKLRSTSLVLVDVPSSSNLDSPHVAQTRRGTIYKTLGGRTVVQYSDQAATGDNRIVWTVPLVNGSQFGVLYSASIGLSGDRLILESPDFGDIPVAFVPGEEGFRPEKFVPRSFGFGVTITFVRLV